jgi:hypothetical protein
VELMTKQYFIPTAIFSQVIEVDATAGVGVAPAIAGDYRAIAGVLAAGTLTVSLDTTAPTLSGISVVDTNTTATLSWSTNEANGSAWWMVDTNATRTAAQVIAGGGVASDVRAVTATGAQSSIVATGLTPSTAYYFHIVHQDAAGNRSTVSSTAFTTEAGAAAFFTTTGTGPYFIDTADPGANVERIEVKIKFRPNANPGATVRLFSQTSTGADVYVTSGGLYGSTLENGDGGGLGIGNSSTNIILNSWQEVLYDADQVAGTVNLYLNGSNIGTKSWTPVTSNDFFQTTRNFGFLAVEGGSQAVPSGWDFEFLEMYKTVLGTRTLHKRIEGNAATVNADAWKLGTNAT